MNYDYCDAQRREVNPYVYIRLKYERKYYRCEYYEGMRILFDSIPQGKHRYETRHSDTDICIPVSIKPEGMPVIVNFCGTIVSDIPIAISEETKVMEVLFTGDSYEDFAKANTHNPDIIMR